MGPPLYDFIAFFSSVVVSCTFTFISRMMRASSSLHKLVKKLDRGKTKVDPKLPYVGPWDKLTDAIVRLNGLNPGMHTLQGTNCYLVGTGPNRILVDTGEGVPGFVEHLMNVMREVGCEGLEAILLTHWHEDHTGGVEDILKRLGNSKIPIFKRVDPKTEKFNYRGIEDEQQFSTEGATLQAVYTPGHTTDHVSFVLQEEWALLTGDMILGCGTAIFDDFSAYMASLNRVLSMSQKRGKPFTRIYPGHGPAVDAAEDKIKFYISHRLERENQIVKTMESAKGSSLSSLQITYQVYGSLPLPLLVSANYNVTHHLSKLIKEGRAEGGWLPCSYRLSGRGLKTTTRE